MRPTRRDILGSGRKRGEALSGTIVLVAIGLIATLGNPSACRAQAKMEPSINDYLPSGDPEPSRDDWRQRVEDAKRRSKDASKERRDNPQAYKPIPEDPAVVATERVLNDDSLQRGDIISTKKGMFQYKGPTDQPRKVDDFVPIDSKTVR